jgi:hypothetical protein
VVILYDGAVVTDSSFDSLVLEEIPPGINIFALLNLRIPSNVTDLQNWKVVFSKNSSNYSSISTMLEVSQYLSMFQISDQPEPYYQPKPKPNRN